MATLLDLLLLLLATTNGHVEVAHVTHVPDYYGTGHDAGARVDCLPQMGGCTIQVSTNVYDAEAGWAFLFGQWTPEGRAYAEIMVHELAHVWDYMDDGLVNGSPGHQQHEFADNTLGQYCSQNAVERYACAVVETRSLTDLSEPVPTSVEAQALTSVEEEQATVGSPTRSPRPLLHLRPQ